jgi:hypothetical protein
MLRDIPDWAYVIITVMILYAGIAFQLHRLETHMEAGFGLVREELALLAGNKERARELREEWRQGRANEKRALRLLLIILGTVGALALASWWLAVSQQGWNG